MMSRFVPEVICTVIVLLLQVMIAPAMSIGLITPNFVLSFCVAFAVASRRPNVVVMPFVAGLLFDLMGTGPVGAFALLCLVFSGLAVLLFFRMDNDTLFIPLVCICICILGADVLYSCICVTCGWHVGLGEALLYRSLPSFLYDTVVALVMYPLLRLILKRTDRNAEMPSIG